MSEVDIRALIERRSQAVRRKDVEGVMACFAEDVVTYDVVDPLRNRGHAEARRRTEEWFGSFEGPLGHEVAELVVLAGAEAGWSHCLSQVRGTKADGGTLEMWWRATSCYRRTPDGWRIVHEHASVPFDPATGQASLGLQP